MSKGFLSVKSMVASKNTLASIVLVVNVFVWYFLVINILKDVVGPIQAIDYSSSILIWSSHFGGIIVSAIVGATMLNRLRDKSRFLVLWVALGVVSSLTSIFVDKTNVPSVAVLALFLGASLGIGMPRCMGYFTESVGIEIRGRVGGVILLLSGMVMALIGTISGGEIFLQTLILSVWRIFGLMFVLLLRLKDQTDKKNVIPTYRSFLSQKSFVLYLIPWLMFSLITYLTIPIQSSLVEKSTLDFLVIIENVLGGISAVVGGLLADAVGRKRMAIAGFAMLGLGYSALGIFPREIFSWYLYTVADGIAWGILFVIFVVTIWGDLSHEAASDKYFAIGVLPFFVSKFLQLTVGNDIATAIPTSAIFSFIAFFLFLAVLPLVYAPETLPEKTMKDRDLKSYTEKALKQVQKEVEKNQKKEKPKPEKEPEKTEQEATEENPEDEEARKLAEKYY
jgi:MFS family permease